MCQAGHVLNTRWKFFQPIGLDLADFRGQTGFPFDEVSDAPESRIFIEIRMIDEYRFLDMGKACNFLYVSSQHF